MDRLRLEHHRRIEDKIIKDVRNLFNHGQNKNKK